MPVKKVRIERKIVKNRLYLSYFCIRYLTILVSGYKTDTTSLWDKRDIPCLAQGKSYLFGGIWIEMRYRQLVSTPFIFPSNLRREFLIVFWRIYPRSPSGIFCFGTLQGKRILFPTAHFGPQKQGPKVSLYPFALHLTARNLILYVLQPIF